MTVAKPVKFAHRQQLAGTFGMVASTHWLASAAGMAVLEGGGNAFDAAAAPGVGAHFPSSFCPREAVPARIHIEERFGETTLSALSARGHDVVAEGPWSLGRLPAVAIGDDGTLYAGATQRGLQGYATGR